MKTIKSLLMIALLGMSQVSFAGPNEDLVAAITEQNTDNLKAALAAGADVNHTFEHYLLWQLNRTKFEKFTPLMLASASGYYDGVLHLLHHKAKANATAKGGSSVYFKVVPVKSVKDVTALHLAAGNGHAEIVKLFMQAGAHKKVVMMQVNASTSNAAKNYVAFVNGVANFTPKKWAKENGQEAVVELWKESKKAAWAKEELPKIN